MHSKYKIDEINLKIRIGEHDILGNEHDILWVENILKHKKETDYFPSFRFKNGVISPYSVLGRKEPMPCQSSSARCAWTVP